MEQNQGTTNKKRTYKQLKRIYFDEEIVKKESAVELLVKHNVQESKNVPEKVISKKRGQKKPPKEVPSQATDKTTVKKRPKKDKLRIVVHSDNIEKPNKGNIDSGTEEEVIPKKKRSILSEKLDDKTIDSEKPTEKPESIRAQKRNKYAKLLEAKQLKSELNAQQNALNYLSKWKHSRDQWKFEKLKQVWLQQSLFDLSKIPNEFWDTTVDYFSGARGAIREKILKDALEIIEKDDNTEEENLDEEYMQKLKRARDIVQNLQE